MTPIGWSPLQPLPTTTWPWLLQPRLTSFFGAPGPLGGSGPTFSFLPVGGGGPRAVELDRLLERIWNDAGASAAERRRALFEVWADCSSLGHAATAADCRGKREAVERFIRAHLPETGADAFRPQEIEDLNRSRRGRQPFTPYAAPAANR